MADPVVVSFPRSFPIKSITIKFLTDGCVELAIDYW